MHSESHRLSTPDWSPSRRLPAPNRWATCEVVAYARNMHKPTAVRMTVDPSERPASAASPTCPTMAVSMRMKAGSAMSWPNVGMASNASCLAIGCSACGPSAARTGFGLSALFATRVVARPVARSGRASSSTRFAGSRPGRLGDDVGIFSHGKNCTLSSVAVWLAAPTRPRLRLAAPSSDAPRGSRLSATSRLSPPGADADTDAGTRRGRGCGCRCGGGCRCGCGRSCTSACSPKGGSLSAEAPV